MRRLHLGCHLEDHDLEGVDCHCGPRVYEVDGQIVVVHVNLT